MNENESQPTLIREAGKALAKLGASKGGRARASVLTPEQRRQIASRAVKARWEKAGKVVDLDVATKPKSPAKIQAETGLPFSMYRGKLDMGNVTLDCHVLNDGRRVLSQTEFVRVMSGGRKRGNLRPYLQAHPLLSEDEFDGRTIEFKIPGNPQTAIGYEGVLLVEFCDSYLQADDQGVLKPTQKSLAKRAAIVVRACAKVGIEALIDEATGYQKVREQRALQIKLQAFIADDMREWALMFPEEFFHDLARLEGIHYSAQHRPLRWGQYIMEFVYRAIDPDIAKELKDRTPNPHHRQNLHQWLKEFGQNKLQNQIQRVIAVMKTCDTMPEFRRRFDKAFSPHFQTDLFDWDMNI